MWRKTYSIGVTLTSGTARFIRISRKNGHITAKAELALPSGLIENDQVTDTVRLGEALESWFREQKIAGCPVHLSVPTAQAVLRKIRVPALDGKALKKVIELEVWTSLHFPFEEPVYDFVPLTDPSADGLRDVLVVAIPKAVVVSYVSALRSAGVKVVSADLCGSALLRVLQSSDGAAPDNLLLLELGEHRMEIFMFHQGFPSFMRSIPLQDLMPGIAYEDLQLLQFDEVQSELSRMLNFYEFTMHEGRERITDVLLTGSYGDLPAFAEHMEQNLNGVRVGLFDFQRFHYEGTAAHAGAFGVPLGLALREVASLREPAGEPVRFMTPINLLPPQPKGPVRFGVMFTLLLAVWVGLVVFLLVLSQEGRARLAEQNRIVAQLDGALTQLSARFAIANGTPAARSAAELAERRKDAAAILDGIRTKAPEGSQIRDLTYTGEEPVRLIIRLKRMEDAADYLESLRTLPFASSVSLQSVKADDEGFTAEYVVPYVSPDAEDRHG